MPTRTLLKRLLGQKDPRRDLIGLDELQKNWTYRPSRAAPVHLVERARRRFHRVAAPPHRVIAPVRRMGRWALYFAYLPDGRLTAAHRYSIGRLRQEGVGLFVVCGSPDPAMIPPELAGQCDALYWKGLSGFDFSAYALGLQAIALASSHADVLVLNDSVFGPFCEVEALFARAAWDLTGFTASGDIENHVQSYAFLLRDWTPAKMAALAAVMPPGQAYDSYRDVVFCQETRLARVAARSMSVGALWYADNRRCSDPTVYAAVPLLDAGFPFLKKSLLSKYAHLHPREELLELLRARGHELP